MKEKTIVFLTHQLGVQGSFLNHLDLQQYLKDQEGYKIRFYCINVKELFSVVKSSRRSYTFEKGEIKILKKEILEPEVVITDFKSLIKMGELNKWIICNKLIVMDSIELTYHLKDMKKARFYYDIDLYKALKKFYTKEVVFLMPPNNCKIFNKKYPDLNAKTFFKLINVNMLETLKFENRPGYFFRWDDHKTYQTIVRDKFGEHGVNYEPEWKLKNGNKIPIKYNEVNHIFDYQCLVYRRRKYLEYQEQFGRLIFEYILLGKTVYFDSDPFTDDGLTDYLRYFDIKFDSSNKILTTKNELRNRMIEYTNKPWEK